MEVLNFGLLTACASLIAVFVLRVVNTSGVAGLRYYLLWMTLDLLMQATFYGVVALCVFARGGSHLDVMKLLGANQEGLLAPRLLYVVSIGWEEITKLVVLVLLLRQVSLTSRSVNSFLLPGLLFGFVEGIFTVSLIWLSTDPFRNPLYFAETFVIDAQSMLSVMLGHSVLMLVYGIPLLSGRLARVNFILSFLIATVLHLSYNEFIAPGLSGWAIDDGISATFAFAAGLSFAIIVFPLRRYAMRSPEWRAATTLLPFASKT